MAKEKKEKKKKFPIPKEKAEAILNMDPKLLGNEIARMQVRIDQQKEDLKANEELNGLILRAKSVEAELIEKDPEVQKLKNQLEDLKQQLKDTVSSEELDAAKLDVKIMRKEFSKDLNADKKELKFMVQTFQSHLHSGAIKLEVR